ncbi:unnamed protein product, partial [Pylaiella littoralis]
RRWCEPSTLTATACVFKLVETTTQALVVKRKPLVNVGAARHREALRRAKVLSAIDPTTLEIKSGDFYTDFAAESRQACLDSKQEIRCFEERQARGDEGPLLSERRRWREPAFNAWSPDGARLSEAATAAACQKGGLGAGPRVPLVEAYHIFRVLNLAERNISTIDPAFAHFENLTELDLGRNRLQALENLPERLVSLSCAANELSDVFDDISTTSPSTLLGLSRLPNIGTTPADSNRSNSYSGEADGAADFQGDEGDNTAELPSPKQWGEIEFLIPGNTHSGINGGGTGLGTFAWASTVTPPPQGSGSRTNLQPTRLCKGEDFEAPVDTTDDVDCDGHPPWDVSVAVPPSEVMRNTVRFEGLAVLLFFVNEEEERSQTGGVDQNMRQEASTAALEPASEGSSPDQGGILTPGDTPPTHAQGDGDHGDNGTQSIFLCGGVSAAGPGAGADADPTGEAPAVVKVSGQCDLVFEPWVVEALQQGITRRKQEKEERRERARLEAEANATNDPKGKNAKAAAAAGSAQQGQEEEGEEEEEIGPSPSARAQV